ncbi:MAG: MCE family protein [Geobacteraceae bacterium]|nr:MCE family protein [Geobacteraceae bacterium]
MISGDGSRFRNLERKVGLFVLTAIIVVIGVVLFIVVENDLFTSTFNVRLTAPKGTGFSIGMPIKLSGFRIGRVKSTVLNESAAVDVVLQIDRKYRKWLRMGSVAKLIKEGMIGDYIIEITSSSSTELIPEDGFIALGKSKSFDEVAEEIADKVKPVLMDVRDIISYVNREDGDLKVTLRNMSRFTGNIEKSRLKADMLLDTGTRQVEAAGSRFDILLAKVDSRVDQVQPILAKMDSSVATVDRKLPQLLEKLDATLAHMESISKELKSTASDALPRIPRMLEKTEGTIDQSSEIIEGAKQIWPLNSVMGPAEQKGLIRRDSNE